MLASEMHSEAAKRELQKRMSSEAERVPEEHAIAHAAAHAVEHAVAIAPAPVPVPTIETCNICLQNIQLDGSHRASCLKCGHVFGHSCITSWLGEQGRRACPVCSVEAHPSDVRIMYMNSMVMEVGAPGVRTPSVTELVVKNFEEACFALQKAKLEDEIAEKANEEALEALDEAYRVRDDAKILHTRTKQWVISQERSAWYREAGGDYLSENRQRKIKMYRHEKERHRAKAVAVAEACSKFIAQGDANTRRHKAALVLTKAQQEHDLAKCVLVDELMRRSQ